MPFGVCGGMWNAIVSVSDFCLFMFFCPQLVIIVLPGPFIQLFSVVVLSKHYRRKVQRVERVL